MFICFLRSLCLLYLILAAIYPLYASSLIEFIRIEVSHTTHTALTLGLRSRKLNGTFKMAQCNKQLEQQQQYNSIKLIFSICTYNNDQ